MPKKLLLFVFSFFIFSQVSAQAPKRELRGAWIATYANIDWPNRTQTPLQQRTALLSILDHHKATGINVIYLQVRSQCDALYASNLEPWSADLTATQGRAPSPVWDPLQFALEECHKRGMELHAWLNPYRAVANVTQLPSFAANHVAKQHPEWLIATGNLRTLDPGLPAVREYILGVIADIIQRYDVDGIHFDDYFYPSVAFNDDVTFNANSRGFTNRADWRRDNVNLLIKSTYETIIAAKPWVKFGVSPSGIYRNSTNPAIGTPTAGLEHYTTLYADSKKWLQEGWVDYIAPQVYWFMGQSGANYSLIVPWWNNQANGRHIYIGMAGYKVNDPAQGASWANPSQIPNEVRLNRKPEHTNIYGQAIYNTSSLRSTTKLGFRDSLRTNFYKTPALLPAMPWRDNTPPTAPAALLASRQTADSVYLNWAKPADATNELDKVKRFTIYRSESPVIDLTKTVNLLAITNTDETIFRDKKPVSGKTYYYQVTALDRFHNESTPSNTTDYLAPVIACAGNQSLAVDAACTVPLPDYSALASVSDDVTPAGALTITQFPAAGTFISGLEDLTVTLTVTDASGKAATCNFTVTKKDTIAPVITYAPDNITVPTAAANTQCSQVVTWTEPTAADNCNPNIQFVSRSHAPGTAFPVGTTTVSYIFEDMAGNESEVAFTVTVEDKTKPIIIAQNITRTLQNGTVTIAASDINNGSWDNCGLDVSSLQISVTSFTCANIGENVVTLTAKDINGNEASATAMVTILGATPAVNVALSRTDNTFTGLPANTLALGYGARALTLTAANTTSAYGNTTYQWSPAAGLSNLNGAVTEFTPSAPGQYIFTVVATNEFGCSNATSVTVNVVDVRCDTDKVLVCHKNNGSKGVNQLCVAAEAVAAHLQKGSTLGTCTANTPVMAEEAEPAVLTAYPNPFATTTTVNFSLGTEEKKVQLEIYDVHGTKLKQVYAGAAMAGKDYTFNVDLSSYKGHFFYARLITHKKVYNFKLVKNE